MRIRYLCIENIKCIDRAELDSLGNVILITGPNGSGKTALLDAIRLWKRALGVYSVRSRDIPRAFGQMVTIGKEFGAISVTLQLSPDERKALNTDKTELTATINIRPDGTIANRTGDSQELRTLFSDRFLDDSRVGIMEHIPSNRSYRGDPVQALAFSPSRLEEERAKILDDTFNKFDQLKADLLWMHFADLQAREKGETSPSFIEGVKRIFRDFLDDVEFLGVDLDTRLTKPPSFLVRTPRGEHEIDQLSSGQKEILMVYSLLEKRKFTNSVILFDEPELHLHGALERKVLGYISKLAQCGNQFFIATHSPEIIGRVTTEDVYRFTGGQPNVCEKVDLNSERISVLRQLGATFHIQMISEKIVFVEGESDREVLSRLAPEIEHKASIVPCGGAIALGKAAELLNRAAKFDNFRAIRDRDLLSDTEIEELEAKYEDKLHIWRKRTIENYLLDEEALFAWLQKVPESWLKTNTRLESPHDIAAVLRQCADTTRPSVEAAYIESQLKNLFPDIKIQPEDPRNSARRALERRLERMQRLLEQNDLEEILNKAEKEITQRWENEWKDICDARDTLRAFCRDYLKGSITTVYPMMRLGICDELVATGRIPREIQEVKEWILA